MASIDQFRNSFRLESLWRRFLSRPLNFVGLCFAFFILLLAFFNVLIRPDKSQFANEQHLELAKLTPLSEVRFLKVRKNVLPPEQDADAMASFQLVPVAELEVQERRVKVKVFNTKNIEEYRFYALLDVFYAVDAGVLQSAFDSQDDRFEFVDQLGKEHTIHFSALKERIDEEAWVTRRYLLGTDQYGRDLLSRLMAGSSISLGVGLSSVLIALLLGLLVGTVSGYAGGWVDRLLSWFMNVFYSIPAILLVVGIMLVVGTGVMGLVVGIGFVLWVEMARIIRGEVISIRQKDYVKAAHLMGFSNARILIHHVLPNLRGPIIILSAGNFADAILMEAGLSFLGIGIQPPKPSWGGMIRELYGYIITDGAFLAIIPGLAIFLMVLAFLIVSHGLKEALDSNIRTRGIG